MPAGFDVQIQNKNALDFGETISKIKGVLLCLEIRNFGAFLVAAPAYLQCGQ